MAGLGEQGREEKRREKREKGRRARGKAGATGSPTPVTYEQIKETGGAREAAASPSGSSSVPPGPSVGRRRTSKGGEWC